MHGGVMDGFLEGGVMDGTYLYREGKKKARKVNYDLSTIIYYLVKRFGV
jgi:hypothetical protein